MAIDSKRFNDKVNYKWKNAWCNLGSRSIAIVSARLRCGFSALNYDLAVNLKVKESAQCTCGSPSEIVFHHFYICPNYNSQILLTNLFEIIPNHVPNLSMLLSAEGMHPKYINGKIFFQV